MSLKNKLILIIEDNIEVIKTLSSIYKATGATVYSADNVDEAQILFFKIVPHLIVLDLNLKDEESGIDFLDFLKNIPIPYIVPVIIFSGFIDKNTLKEIEKYQIAEILEKPIVATTLIQKARKHIKEHSTCHLFIDQNLVSPQHFSYSGKVTRLTSRLIDIETNIKIGSNTQIFLDEKFCKEHSLNNPEFMSDQFVKTLDLCLYHNRLHYNKPKNNKPSLSNSLIHIYILDDDDLILDLIEHHLSSIENVSIKKFNNPASFLKSFKKNKPDLCLIDLNLGINKGEGFSVIGAIRKKVDKNITLIIISSRKSHSDLTYAIEVGSNDYIIKPLIKNDLLLTVKKHLKSIQITENFEPGHELPISENTKTCTFNLGFFLYQISESGLIILTQHFIPRRTKITFNSGKIYEIVKKELTITVGHTWVHPESGLFAVAFVFPQEDISLKLAFRNWIMLKQNTLSV